MAKQTPAALQNSAGLLRTPGIPYKGTTIHTLVTSNGSPYLNFQNRIMCAPNMHPSSARPILSCLLAFSVANPGGASCSMSWHLGTGCTCYTLMQVAAPPSSSA